MFSNRERNRSSIPDDTLRDGFITVLQSQSTGAENHVPQRKGIPKINYFKSQAFQAQNPFSCKSDYFAKPKELPTSAAYAFFTGDYVPPGHATMVCCAKPCLAPDFARDTPLLKKLCSRFSLMKTYKIVIEIINSINETILRTSTIDAIYQIVAAELPWGCLYPRWVAAVRPRTVMSSIMRRRNGLIALSVMGLLLSEVRFAKTPNLNTGQTQSLYRINLTTRSKKFRESGFVL